MVLQVTLDLGRQLMLEFNQKEFIVCVVIPTLLPTGGEEFIHLSFESAKQYNLDSGNKHCFKKGCND